MESLPDVDDSLLASKRRIQHRKDCRVSWKSYPKISKASKSKIALGLGGHQLAHARKVFRGDLLKKSSQSAYLSRLRTLKSLAIDESGAPLTLLPVTAHCLETVATKLREASYESGDRYLSTLRCEHEIRHGETYPLDKPMKLMFSRAMKSLRLGHGRRKRATTFCAHSVVREAGKLKKLAGSKAIVSGGPFSPLTDLSLQIAWALREMEAASLLFAHLHVNCTLRVATLTFVDQKSRTNIQEITHGCAVPTSDAACPITVFCPFCQALRHKERLRALYLKHGLDDTAMNELPLFPTDDGTAVHVNPRLDTLRALVAASGEQLIDATGAHRFSRHSPRRTALRVLIDGGATVRQASAISRHSSKCVCDYMESTEAVDTTVVASLIQPRLCGVQPMPLDLKSFQLEVSSVPGRLAETWGASHFAINTASDRIHCVKSITDFKSKCGFKFHCCPWTDLVKTIPARWNASHLCGQCFSASVQSGVSFAS